MELSLSQQNAIRFVSDHAQTLKAPALEQLRHLLTMCNLTVADLEATKSHLQKHAQVALHFHPDRLAKGGMTVCESFLQDGRYKNQFETLLSNGKLDPKAEGLRAKWENQLFGCAFESDPSKLFERPKYGALQVWPFIDGPSPRFGSCYFLLKPQVSQRCTFTYMDSHLHPEERGTLETFDGILAACLTECFERRFALGQHDVSVSELLSALNSREEAATNSGIAAKVGRNLNHYIEAQVHGDIYLGTQVHSLVADVSFRGQQTGVLLQHLAEQYELSLQWHGGFQMSVESVPLDFRGALMPSLAKRISVDGVIDAHVIGTAVQQLLRHPADWADWAHSREDTLQQLKYLWHVLVQFGHIHGAH